MSKKVKLVIIFACISIFLIVYIFMFISVNFKFPQSTKEIYKIGEEFEYQNIKVKINDAYFVEDKELQKDKEFLDLVNHYYENQSDNIKFVILDMEIQNPDDQENSISLIPFHLESNDFSLQADLPFVMYLNECGMQLELKKNEIKKLKFPVPLSEKFFRKSEWHKVKNRDYYLVYSLYPVKKMIEIDVN